ncbi:hypothetical protein H6F78_01855 [Coleofasciculus sp. FACHB-64]|uniref:hypothetical protein n=1 Tax=Cyanophyceae TaxID=3028117 RepID=UPI0016878C76|nr:MULTISPECIES: hypothetical protein [unclassified Coleofasciculus]MBD1837809.1 hypothetical protein [Coleofasciculus sp. FACHB-501]MBD1888129.1 hypothetical protein [Coleofasciculus sp. FACHB-SPT9]MBD2044384.1 hypothetical protein [Coleofasciculus sp. FACHB-64]MBD2088167.1 hypothetical protein [Coleofasciculus sp. FACHB-542]
MFSQVYYLIRSRADGQYLLAQPDTSSSTSSSGYLLMFGEHFDALSYLNAHAPDVSDRFAVESISGNQVKGLLQRWGFKGIGMVEDPLLPKIQFLSPS